MALLTLAALMIRLTIDVTTNGGWKSSKHPEEIVRAIIISVVLNHQDYYSSGGDP